MLIADQLQENLPERDIFNLSPDRAITIIPNGKCEHSVDTFNVRFKSFNCRSAHQSLGEQGTNCGGDPSRRFALPPQVLASAQLPPLPLPTQTWP